MPSLITAGDASNGLVVASGNDGAVTIQSGPAGAKVNALSIAASGATALAAGLAVTGAITANSAAATAPFIASINGGEVMRINSAGNVGIGTSSPSKKLEVYATSNSLQIQSVVRNDQAGSGVAAIGFNVSSGAAGETSASKAGIGLQRGASQGVGSLCFYNSASTGTADFTTSDERMRINSSGVLLVGTTATFDNVSYLPVQVLGGLATKIANSGPATQMSFINNNGRVGFIGSDGTSATYNTSSDYRLKEDWQPMTGASERVKALKPVNFAWKVDGSRTNGFLAHEAQEVVPEAVRGTKDAVDKDGKPDYQGIDQSKLVPLLTAALQEALAKIDSLTTRIEALEIKQ